MAQHAYGRRQGKMCKRDRVTFEYSVNVTEIDAFGFGSTGQYGTSIPDDAPAGFGIVIGLSQCGLRQQETAKQPEQH